MAKQSMSSNHFQVDIDFYFDNRQYMHILWSRDVQVWLWSVTQQIYNDVQSAAVVKGAQYTVGLRVGDFGGTRPYGVVAADQYKACIDNHGIYHGIRRGRPWAGQIQKYLRAYLGDDLRYLGDD